MKGLDVGSLHEESGIGKLDSTTTWRDTMTR